MLDPLVEVGLSSLYEVVDRKGRVALQTTQAFIATTKSRRDGRIGNICSRVTQSALNRTNYSAAKSALIGCTRTWALELAQYGITVNAVSPGPIETELFRAGQDRKSVV